MTSVQLKSLPKSMSSSSSVVAVKRVLYRHLSYKTDDITTHIFHSVNRLIWNLILMILDHVVSFGAETQE